MSNKTPHRRLQRLAEDELGVRPKLQTCLNIMHDATRDLTLSMEEHIAQVFLENRERLLASGKKKASPPATPGDVKR